MRRFVLLCALAISGCISPPLQEYNYRALFPDRYEVSRAVASGFAADLAAKSGFHIVEQSKVTGSPDVDATFAVYLKSPGAGDVFVTVMVNMPSRTLFIGIGGNIISAVAKSVAQDAEVLFSETYPGLDLVAFTRKQGLLGP